jgi:trimethylamine corrinoid protein
MLNSIIKAYNEAVFETDSEAAFAVVDQALADGITAEDIVFQVVIPAVEEMMSRITKDPDTNLAQHFTASGDLHSLGKRIVMGCLKALMVDVTDLGVNVPAERFVDQAVAIDAQVIAVSAMMVHTATGPKGAMRIRELLRERGLEERIRIVVGGAPYRFDEQLYKAVGADAWAADGVSAGKVIVDLIREVKP